MTIQALITSVFRKEILSMSAYKVANADSLIKLDAMENPYTWQDDIKQQWLEKLSHCQLNRYPDPEAKKLIRIIKQSQQLPDALNILLGNGSDEIIQMLQMALPANATVLTPEPGFVMYRQIAHSLGLNFQGVSLRKEDFDLDIDTMLQAIAAHQPALIFIAYPNNPSGNLFNETAITRIIEASPGLVVIDEAYAPFAKASFIDRLSKHNNLLVMRTFSKLGLAGLRLGFIIGQPEIIAQLNKIRLPYNINTLTQVSAEFALENSALFEQQTQQICAERALVFQQLTACKGITAFPTAANFILFRCPKNSAHEIFQSILKQGVLIKNLSPQGGALKDCLRVTIGKPEENKQFIAALTQSLKKYS